MQFKVKRSRWMTTTCVKRMQKVANHIFSHYPKDSGLHRAFCDAWQSVDRAGAHAWSQVPKGSTMRRRTTSWKRRSTSRTAIWKRTPKRSARRATPKRRSGRRGMRRAA
jgi:hypothetical protein